MYRVIVADDEEEIRRGLIKKVNWEAYGFEVAGEAENGADALELVEKLEPDLLVTDIRMPFLSGTELARQIREVRPSLQIVFLSGFDDFSYAQQAIQYNIIRYLLKPISSRQFEEELAQIKKEMDQKFEEFSRAKKATAEVEKTEFLFPLLLDGYLRTDTDEEELVQEAKACGLLQNQGKGNLRYTVMVTAITGAGEARTTRASVDAVDMILKKYVYYASCYVKGYVVSILAATPAGFSKYLHILAEEILQSVERILHMKCSIGISRSVRSFKECRECYLEALNAISYGKRDESSVYFIADEEKSGSFTQEEMETVVDRLESLLRGGAQEELDECLEELKGHGRAGQIQPVLLGFLNVKMYSSVFGVVYAVAGDEEVRKLQDRYPLADMRLLESSAESFSLMQELYREAKQIILNQRKKSGEVICDKAVRIIRDRYADQDLSVLSVSEEIGVSPNYLSSLIRKNTGRTFVELLTERRIEKARELLLGTSMKIREITEACGYKDQYYFSHCFKKLTGVSPGGMRRANEEK